MDARKSFESREIGHEERANKFPPLADDQHLGHQPILLKQILQLFRRDEFSAARLEEVLLAARDGEITFAVERAEVAGAEPAVGKRFAIFFVQLVVPARDARPSHQNFSPRHAVPIHKPIVELYFQAANDSPDRAQLRRAGVIDRDDRRSFG